MPVSNVHPKNLVTTAIDLIKGIYDFNDEFVQALDETNYSIPDNIETNYVLHNKKPCSVVNENFLYFSEGDGQIGVSGGVEKSDGKSQQSYNDCSGFITGLIGIFLTQFKLNSGFDSYKSEQKVLFARQFYDSAISGDNGLKEVSFHDVQIGDLLITKKINPQAEDDREIPDDVGGATGHVMLIGAIEDNGRDSDDRPTWVLTVIDQTGTPHSHDVRTQGDQAVTGLGFGKVLLMLDEDTGDYTFWWTFQIVSQNVEVTLARLDVF